MWSATEFLDTFTLANARVCSLPWQWCVRVCVYFASSDVSSSATLLFLLGLTSRPSPPRKATAPTEPLATANQLVDDEDEDEEVAASAEGCAYSGVACPFCASP